MKTWDTFDGWQDSGRHVRKGERHRRRDNAGVCYFHRSQTDQTRQPAAFRRADPDSAYDEASPGNGDYPITAFDMGADF